MTYLLANGFDVKSISSEDNNLPITIAGEVFKSVSSALSLSQPTTAYYLENAGGRFYRCAHERNTSFPGNILCWQLEPEYVALNGKDQLKPGDNPLLGTWTGKTYVDANLADVKLTFTADRLVGGFTQFYQYDNSVTYDLARSGRPVIHVGNHGDIAVLLIGSNSATFTMDDRPPRQLFLHRQSIP